MRRPRPSCSASLSPDVEKLTALVAGRDGGERQDALAAVLAVRLPLADDVERDALELEAAAADVDAASIERSRLDTLRDQLLSDALDLHDESGASPCLVCETGHLDAAWRQRVTEALGQTNLIRQRLARRSSDCARPSGGLVISCVPALVC